MLTNRNLKYKIHILTSLNNNSKIKFSRQNSSNENDFIYQSIDNLKQTIENIIYRQFKPSKNIHYDKFQHLLSYINQLLGTFKDQYHTFLFNSTTQFCVTTNTRQQQMTLNK
jgi:hypothetical protein